MNISVSDIPLLGLVFAVLFAGLYISITATARAYLRKELWLWIGGLIFWFIYQSLLVEFLWAIRAPFQLVLASAPISLSLVLLLILFKQPSIASGIFSAIICNAVMLAGLTLAGVIDDEGIGGIFTYFPPFFFGTFSPMDKIRLVA